jgi:hypothetical protein
MNRHRYFVVLLNSLVLALMLILPGILWPMSTAGAPLFQGSTPVDGHWTGTTSRGQPMSFDGSGGDTVWSSLKLKTTFSIGGCSGTVEVTVSPGTITNNQFSYNGGTFSFSGQFTSPTTASGTYAFVNHPGCGSSFTQSGTWTASGP